MNSARILVVEDSLVNQKVISHVLNLLAYEHELVTTGLEAVEAMRAGDYRLILMDLRTPDMDGFAAARKIRDQGLNIPIVAYSASPQSDDMNKCRESGMDDFLQKPATPADLRKMIEKWIT